MEMLIHPQDILDYGEKFIPEEISYPGKAVYANGIHGITVQLTSLHCFTTVV